MSEHNLQKCEGAGRCHCECRAALAAAETNERLTRAEEESATLEANRLRKRYEALKEDSDSDADKLARALGDAGDAISERNSLRLTLREIRDQQKVMLEILRALVSSLAHSSVCQIIEVGGCNCGAWEKQNPARGEAVAILRGEAK